jgi:tetratricopeptide (TPR) repeat protein
LILPLLALLAAASNPDQARFEGCVKLIDTNPQAAVEDATQWRIGGGVPAGMCLGLAFVAQERWGPAALAFEQTAVEAERQGDGRAANLWVQAGNAALAGGDAARARNAFDRALALPTLSPPMRGEAWLDRARAEVAAGNLPAARTNLDEAIKLVPGDPLAWLLSADLAMKQGDKARAAADIAKAQRLAPDEPAILAQAKAIAAK